MPSRTKSELQKFAAADLSRFGQSLLIAAGLAKDRAHDVAEVLLEADLLGHTTHGLALLPAYLKELKNGKMRRTGEPKLVADHGSAFTWDGCYLPGQWLVRRAIATARERLTRHSVVTAVIRRSHHIGCLEAYLQRVTDAGILIWLTCSDPNSRTVAPHGGIAPRYSPNPIAVGIPTDANPILIDISTSSTSNALCNRLAAAKERLPGKWLVDKNGTATDDPRVLSKGGALLPLGGLDLGYKGFALGIFVEALTNALSGHGRANDDQRWGASVFLQIIDPKCFGGRAAFLREMSFFVESCRATAPRRRESSMRLPGQAALARRREQLVHGVALHPTILPSLIPWAKEFGIALPSCSRRKKYFRNGKTGLRTLPDRTKRRH